MSVPDDHPHALRPLLPRAVTCLLGLVAMYILGSGPAKFLSFRFGIGEQLDGIRPLHRTPAVVRGIEIAYLPLSIIAEKTKTNRLLWRYQFLWILTCQPREGYTCLHGNVIFAKDGSATFVRDPAFLNLELPAWKPVPPDL